MSLKAALDDLAEELRPIYTRFGHALPDKNGDESWACPYRRPTLSTRMARSVLVKLRPFTRASPSLPTIALASTST